LPLFVFVTYTVAVVWGLRMVYGLRSVYGLGVCGFLVLGACTGKEASDTDTGTDTDTDTDTEDAPVGIVSVSPSTLEFDALEWGCGALSIVSISNTGDGDLTLSSLDIALSDVFTLAEVGLPVVLNPGDVQDITVEFMGDYSEIGAHTATLTIGTDDAVTPESIVAITGDVLDGSMFEESFVSRADEVDILFSFDRSCGMYDDGLYVAETFPTFIQALQDHGSDYRVSLTVGDDGCIVGPDLYIDTTVTPEDSSDIIETMLDLNKLVTPSGYNEERPFALMEAALDQDDSGACNDGLLRPGADLVLIGVGDEPEQSPNPWDDYLVDFQALMTDDAQVTVNGLGADGCNNGLSTPAFYGFDDAIYATGGVLYDLCFYDRPTSFEGLADFSIGRRAVYSLSKRSGTTPTVVVDGAVSTDGVYSSTPPEIRFSSEDAPSSLSTVDISYPVSSCL